MQAAAGNEERLVRFSRNGVQAVGEVGLAKPFGERIAGHAFGQAGNDPGPGCRVGYVPRLGLGFPAKRGGNLGRRMDLYGKIRLGIQ